LRACPHALIVDGQTWAQGTPDYICSSPIDSHVTSEPELEKNTNFKRDLAATLGNAFSARPSSEQESYFWKYPEPETAMREGKHHL
jgi:hypothetical protein